MALARTTDNIKADIWDIYIDGTAAPYHARVNVPVLPDLHPVRSAATGTDVIAMLVQGRSFDFSVDFQQATKDEIRDFLNVASTGDVPVAPLGSVMPTREVRIRHADAADHSDDIVIVAAVLKGLTLDSDGAAEIVVATTWTATRDSSGDVVRIGKAMS